MLYEVVSTHAETGLFKGRAGFAPVAVTRDMPRPLIQLMADVARRQADAGPPTTPFAETAFCHFPLFFEQRPYHLVSRGVYTRDSAGAGKSDRWLIHQMLLDQAGSISGGPAWLLGKRSVWMERWEAQPQYLEPRSIESQIISPRICKTWQEHAGDAGWAGVAVESMQKGKNFLLIVPDDFDPAHVLEMFAEAISLVDAKLRWNCPIAVSTWIPPKLQRGAWTALPASSPEAAALARDAGYRVVDISRPLETAANAFSEIARAGDWARLDSSLYLRPDPAKKATVKPTSESAPLDYSLFESDELSGTPATGPSPAGRGAIDPLRPRRSARAVPWLGIALIVALVSLTGFTIWTGFRFLDRWMNLAAQDDSQRPAPGRPAPVLGTGGEKPIPPSTNDIEDAVNQNATAGASSLQPRDSTYSTPSTPARLSELAATRLLDEIRERALILSLPAESALSDQPLVAIPTRRELVRQIGFGLATPTQFVDLTPDNRYDDQTHRYSAEISDPAGGDPLTVQVELRETQGDESSITDVLWSWSAVPELELATELSSGALVIWMRRSSSVSAAIPLARPAPAEPFRLIDAMFAGMQFQPHLAEWFVASESPPQVQWSASVSGFAPLETGSATPVGEQVWLIPNSKQNKSDVFRLDQYAFESRIVSSLQAIQQPGDDDIRHLERPVEEVLEMFNPVSIDVRLENPHRASDESSHLAVRVRAVLYMRMMDGSKNSIIFQTNPRTSKPLRLEEFREKIKTDLANWLAKGFGMARQDGATLQEGGYLPEKIKSLPGRNPTPDQLKPMVAQFLYQAIVDLFEREMEFDVTRTSTLLFPSGPSKFETRACAADPPPE